MIEWIEVTHKLPEYDCFCIVTNIRAHCGIHLAMYHGMNKYFSDFNDRSYDGLPIDATHYIVVPRPPNIAERMDPRD